MMKRLVLMAAALLATAAGLATAPARAGEEYSGSFYFGKSSPCDGIIAPTDITNIRLQAASGAGNYFDCKPNDPLAQDVDGDNDVAAGDITILKLWVAGNMATGAAGKAYAIEVLTPSLVVPVGATCADGPQLCVKLWDNPGIGDHTATLRPDWGVNFKVDPASPCNTAILCGRDPTPIIGGGKDQFIQDSLVFQYTGLDGPATACVRVADPGGCGGQSVSIDTYVPDDLEALYQTGTIGRFLGLPPVTGAPITGTFAGSPGPAYTLFIAATDWAGANKLYSVTADSAGVPGNTVAVADLGPDPRLDPMPVTRANAGGTRYLLEREAWGAGLGEIAQLGPAPPYPVNRVFPAHDGVNAANPQDLLTVGPGRAYVTRFEPAYNDVLIVNPDTGAAIANINLTPFADQLPHATKMFSHAGLAFVLLQDYSAGWPAVFANGKIAVIDPALDGVVNVIPLTLQNPAAFALIPATGLALIAATGDWSDPATAGVELVDLAAQTSLGVIIPGNDLDLGGFITDVIYLGGNQAALINSPADWSANQVRILDLDTHRPGPVIYSAAFIPDLEPCGANSFMAADSTNSQVAVLAIDTLAVIKTIPLAVAPVAMTCW
jgi:hypothetical protein